MGAALSDKVGIFDREGLRASRSGGMTPIPRSANADCQRVRQPAIERDPRRRGADSGPGRVHAGGQLAGDGPGTEEAGGLRALPGTAGEDFDQRAGWRGEVF